MRNTSTPLGGRFSLVEWSIRRPKLVVSAAGILALAALTPFARVKTDTNPKNMLPATSDVRVWNDEVEKTFALYEDMIVVGVEHEEGVLNPESLAKIGRITDEAMRSPGVAAKDVTSLKTVDDVTLDRGMLNVSALMPEAPRTAAEAEALKQRIFDNPLLLDRLVSRDGRTTAVYVPLVKGADGKKTADALREIVGRLQGPEKYYVAGDPVARDTFGAEMFKLMGVFSPVSGMIMLGAIFLMFRSLSLAFSVMAVAMISIIWSMGLLIALGFPIHIMSSMAPVFLMAIATDSIHIFNEFYFRYREKKNKIEAIRGTMNAVGRPVRYTALATAAGFGVLLFMHIIPVKVFGGLVAFGTVVLRLLSFSFIPAILTFIKEDKIAAASGMEDIELSRTARGLRALGRLGASHPRLTVLAGLMALGFAVAGTTRTVVNNNMVNWFKEGSEVRTADRVMNRALGGTSLAYVVAASDEEDFFKNPQALLYLEGLQRTLEKLPVVGKTTSVADYVKRINRVLHGDSPQFDVVPQSREEIAQYLFLFGMSAKPADLDNVVDYRFQKANVWVQLKTWDAGAMREVKRALEEYAAASRLPLELKPAGVAYFNLVWNDEVLWDMVKGFGLALAVVFVILALNFRSIKWAVIGYVPLLFTILLIYGVLGFAGKDFDMPISVLSCLSLGMAVDFAIHFISRFKQRLAETAGQGGRAASSESVVEALLWTAGRPGKGIMRNAVLFASAFSVMLFAPLTPYVTVGGFIVAMMTLSALMTILYLPALVVLFRRGLFGGAKS